MRKRTREEEAERQRRRRSKGRSNRRTLKNIYVNDEDIRFMQNLETPVGDDDELSIVPAIAGGTRT